ncbi:MAG: hypothetical protein KJ729_02165 [Euryarchaeota archaeon]|nr:hypothetical protein [Euryarchaeota archaeon]
MLTQKSNNYLPGRSVYLWLTPVSDIHCSTIAMSFGRILAFVDLAAMMMRVFPGADRTSMPP